MPKVLVVEDEADTLEVVRAILEDAGLQVVTAHNGEKCLETLEREEVDLVLLDVIMPKMSGWETFRIIREKHRKQKVAFLSVVSLFVAVQAYRQERRRSAEDHLCA